MAENTQIVQQNSSGMVEYMSNGEKVKLSPSMIRNYLGGKNATEQEVMSFLFLCKFQKLNPFLKEAYLIKYGSQDATIVTGKEVFTKRAEDHPNYNGLEAGVIVLKQDGTIEERQGEFSLKSEQIVGGWARVHFKNSRIPHYASVSFEEYAGRKSNGDLNSNWSGKPGTMIRKVALVHALREAFPKEFQGLYAEEEFAKVTDVATEVQTEIEQHANSKEFEIPNESEAIDAEVTELPEFMEQE